MTETLIWPTLRYDDARAAIRWLVDVLGFEASAVYGEGDRVDHAQLTGPGGGGVMLSSARDDGPIDIAAGVGSVYLVIDTDGELTRLYERVLSAGGTVVRELKSEDYGGSGFACRDPQGVFWSLGTYRGE